MLTEKKLLILCLCTAIIGITGIFFLPAIPETTYEGELRWKNGTTGLLIQEQEIWFETTHPILYAVPQKIFVTGSFSGGRVTNAHVAPALQESHHQNP